jgi:alpha-glucosidase (family GH31 glycosyl hydrolase)
VSEPTTLKVYRGADGQFTLYEDDGTSLDYLQGQATWTRMSWDDSANRLTIEPGAPAGSTNLPSNRMFRVELLPEGTTRNVSYSGQRAEVSF